MTPSNVHTCLSTERHDDNVLDVTFHYFGCLEASEHEEYFANLPQKSKKRIVEEKERIRQHRAYFEARPSTEGGTALKNFKSTLTEWRQHNHIHDTNQAKLWLSDSRAENSVEKDIKASVICFKDSKPYNAPGVNNSFPNQKITVSDLLSEDADCNPLMQQCEDGVIRYFHLPANNMLWVEEAIARYYGEKRIPADSSLWFSKSQRKTKSQMLLSPEFWSGQQEGSRSHEVHARGMRPLCETISIDPTEMEASPNNMVLFMPYLHWETDTARSRSAKTVKEVGELGLSSLGEVVDQVRENEHHVRNSRIVNAGQGFDLHQDELPIPAPIYNATKAPLALRRETLGRLLRWAALFARDIDSIIDERLYIKYLHADPPLHPRRTLDQSYYKTLKNTQQRDRDQVVYRATAPRPHECSKKIPTDKCAGCNEDARSVPRVIMVDQLWLWILDEKTIISSFPRRWGKNRVDASAVHKNIRKRLREARGDEISSVYDIALIVVDQCSKVFFDRSRPLGLQPNLVDNFADAIRGVTYMQAAAFDQFLTYTHIASADYNSREKSGSSSSYQNTLLNINPEGNLLKEIKDILDELLILTRIKIQQQVVAETFVRNIRHILRPRVLPKSGDRHLDTILLDVTHADLKRAENSEAAKWTLTRADNLLAGIQSRISELNTLQGYAKNTSSALKDLLTLKQQQSGIFEAREAVKQATETLNQGRSIMLFTVVTIIFLPLSFCASIFGMNTLEFNGSSLTLREEFSYMFPISIGIIVTSFTLAFSSSSFMSSFSTIFWATITYPLHVATTWFLTTTGLYALSRELYTRANVLKEKDKRETNMMKANALRLQLELRAGAMKEKMEMMKMKNLFDRDGSSTGDEVEGAGDGSRRRTGTLSEVEMGQSSRHGSEARLQFSPRV